MSLPLPKSTINALFDIREDSSDFGIQNLCRNTIDSLMNYDYQEGVEMVKLLQKNDPSLMDYAKHIKLIMRANKRYEAI